MLGARNARRGCNTMKMPLGFNRERRAKRSRAAFAALIATPGTGALAMPAGARVMMRATTSHTAGDTAATFAGRTIATGADIDSGAWVNVGWLERGVTITPATGFDLYIDIGMGWTAKIGGP